jgi:tyrosyl-tRNA synthetase
MVSVVAEQLERIRRGVEQIVPEAELVKKLERSHATRTPLRIKFGIDPTGFDVHLGHTVPLRKLRHFQELGHLPVLILGDYTARVGDPSGRDDSRKGLTGEQIEANARDYLTQIGRIIDVSPGRAEVRYNGEWFGRFTFGDVLGLTGQITVQRMLERDDFTKRIKAGREVYLSECLYPLMQGRDSVEICADVELGGSEQLYNLMVGRKLQVDAGQEPQICITMPILRGLDGKSKMGKSAGNYVGVAEQAKSQFFKTMSIADDLMLDWFTLLTDRSTDEAKQLIASDPFEAKKVLAGDIVCFYHGSGVARDVRKQWEDEKSKGQDPTDIPDTELPAASLADGQMSAAKLLVALKMVASGGEARRLVQQGGMNVGDAREKISDPNALIPVPNGLIVRAGPKRIARVRLV